MDPTGSLRVFLMDRKESLRRSLEDPIRVFLMDRKESLRRSPGDPKGNSSWIGEAYGSTRNHLTTALGSPRNPKGLP